MSNASFAVHSNTTVWTCFHLFSFSLLSLLTEIMIPLQVSWNKVLEVFILPSFSMLEMPRFLSRVALKVEFKPWLFAFPPKSLPRLKLTLLGLDLCSLFFRAVLSSMTPSLTEISSNTYIRALPATAHLAGRRLHHLDIFPAWLGFRFRVALQNDPVKAFYVFSKL